MYDVAKSSMHPTFHPATTTTTKSSTPLDNEESPSREQRHQHGLELLVDDKAHLEGKGFLLARAKVNHESRFATFVVAIFTHKFSEHNMLAFVDVNDKHW